ENADVSIYGSPASRGTACLPKGWPAACRSKSSNNQICESAHRAPKLAGLKQLVLLYGDQPNSVPAAIKTPIFYSRNRSDIRKSTHELRPTIFSHDRTWAAPSTDTSVGRGSTATACAWGPGIVPLCGTSPRSVAARV